jgi:hypothetical protein
MDCLAPELTMTSLGSIVKPCALPIHVATALRSGTVPSTSVYLVAPASSAFLAASLMCAGRVEVGLAGAEADDVDARGLQLGRLGGHGQGRGRFDDGQPTRELHGFTPCLRFSASAATTPAGTRPETSPPINATSFTSDEDT